MVESCAWEFPDLDSGRGLIGVIELSREKNVLAIQTLQGNLEINDGTWFWFWIAMTFAQLISDCNAMFYLKM